MPFLTSSPVFTGMLLATMLLRSLVVDGYMPGEGGIELCTPDGMVSVTVDRDTDEVVEVDHDSVPECPWQSVFFNAVAVPSSPLLSMPVPHGRHDVLAITARAGIDSNGLPPSRAPPGVLS